MREEGSMTDQEYRGNMNYPFQDHIVLNVEENVVPFPRTNLRKCQHAQVEIDRLRAELEKAKAQAVPEKKIYLTCEQLYAAANFGAPNKDPELLETELTIAWFDEAHSGSGYYVYISEYPEEGAMKLESELGAEG